jgi:hypothetical protein
VHALARDSSTFRGSVAARAVARAVARAPKSDQAASAGTAPSRAEAVAGTANTDKTLRFDMLSSSGGTTARAAATRGTVTESSRRVIEVPVFRVAPACATAPRRLATRDMIRTWILS